MSKTPKKQHRVEVEQAIAYGRTPDWMAEHLGATDQEIDAALRWLDACNDEDEQGRAPIPCGSHAAYNRHKAKGEPVCSRCRYAEAEYQAERNRARTGRTKSGHVVGGRPIESYSGAAARSVIAELIDALSPTYSRTKKQQKDAA
jgi:hypothetical protein